MNLAEGPAPQSRYSSQPRRRYGSRGYPAQDAYDSYGGPGWPVAVVELGQRSVRVDVVAQNENSASNAVEKLCGALVLGPITAGDVACPDEHRVGGLSQRWLRQWDRLRSTHQRIPRAQKR